MILPRVAVKATLMQEEEEEVLVARVGQHLIMYQHLVMPMEGLEAMDIHHPLQVCVQCMLRGGVVALPILELADVAGKHCVLEPRSLWVVLVQPVLLLLELQ